MSAPNQYVTADRTYAFGTIPPSSAIRVELAVVKAIGEPLFKMAMTKNKSKEEDEAAMMAAMVMLAKEADPDELLATTAIVFKSVSIGNLTAAVDIDTHMIGRNKELWIVMFAALRFNFSDFMPAVPSVSLPTAAAPASA